METRTEKKEKLGSKKGKQENESNNRDVRKKEMRKGKQEREA